jgi:hypothetical protein
MEEDVEEVIDLDERDRKRLEIECLKSEKTMRTAEKSAFCEVNVRKRNAYFWRNR